MVWGRSMIGRTRSSATSMTPSTSMPVWTPSLSSAATSTSVWVLPAPAPSPQAQPSTWLAPSSMAASELPTAEPRLLWAWMPTSTSPESAARSAATRRRASAGGGLLQVGDRADAGQQQHGELGAGHGDAGGGQQLVLGLQRAPVLQR